MGLLREWNGQHCYEFKRTINNKLKNKPHHIKIYSTIRVTLYTM